MCRWFPCAALFVLVLSCCKSAPQTGGKSDVAYIGADSRKDGPVGEAGKLADRVPDDGRARRVIMISIDGCRWDYLEDEQLVNLRAIRDNGAFASQVKVTNPSMTAPGHVTLITGAWAGTHGIVFNKFYDREVGLVKFFDGIAPAEQTTWLLAEPVWVGAEKAGLVTASVHWAATAGEYDGEKVDHALPFKSSVDDQWRISQAIDLFMEARPHLLLVYTGGVSSMIYKHGVGSVQVRDKLRSLDGWIGNLVKGVEKSDMAEQTDIMVVSDHGFGAALEKEVCLSWLLDQQGIAYDFILWGAVGHVFLKNPEQAEVVRELVVALEGVDRVLLRSEADELHLATENRTGDLLVVMQQGWQVANMWRPCDSAVVAVQPGWESAGTHGYPAEEDEDMRGIFMVAGPHVKHADLGVVRQIDIAPTVSALLEIAPPANADGLALDVLLVEPAAQTQ